MKIMLNAGAYMPTRAHNEDAGLDLYARLEAVAYRMPLFRSQMPLETVFDIFKAISPSNNKTRSQVKISTL